MSTSIFIKVFSDCCLCMAFVCLVSIPHSSNAPLLVAMLLCALAASLASVLHGKCKGTLSRLCCLLPLLSLFAAGDVFQLLTMLVPIIYTGIVILRGMLYLEYYAYRQYVIVTSILLLCVYIFAYIVAPLINFMYDGEIVDTYTFLGFGSIHVLSGFFLLRRLRIGSDRVIRRSFRPVTVIAASAVVLSVVWWAMDACFSKLLHALDAVAELVVKASKLLVFNLIWDTQKGNPTKDRPSQTPSTGPIAPEPSEPPTVPDTVPPDTANTVPPDTIPEPQDNFSGIDLNLPEPDVGTILLVILVLVVLAVLVLMVLSFRARSQKVIERETIAPLKGSERKSKKAPPLSNRARVRQLYRTFLRQEIRHGMTLRPSDTTEDILRKLRQDADLESAAALRKIYIQARYDQNHPVSHEQVEKAREALKHLQDDK